MNEVVWLHASSGTTEKPNASGLEVVINERRTKDQIKLMLFKNTFHLHMVFKSNLERTLAT